MAKNKSSKAPVENGDKQPAGSKAHHRDLLAAGAVPVSTSQPKGKPYKWEEWLSRDRKLRVLKVYEDGTISAYEEVANYSDPRAAAESQS